MPQIHDNIFCNDETKINNDASTLSTSRPDFTFNNTGASQAETKAFGKQRLPPSSIRASPT
jgi:hypothetical protein